MTASQAINVNRHLKFARAIARGVRRDYCLLEGGQDERDLEQEAYLELLNCANRFDPSRVGAAQDHGAQFQKFAKEAIRSRCKREALRLKNGGMYNTTRTPGAAPHMAHKYPTGFEYEERRREAGGRRGRLVPLAGLTARVTDTALALDGEPDLREWAAAVGQLVARHRSVLWWLGDLYLYGAARFGPDADDLLGALGYADESVKVAAWVCGKFPPVARATGLSFRHHQIFAALPLTDARALLQRCAREGLSTRAAKALRDAAKGAPKPRPAGYLKLLATPQAQAEAKALGVELSAVVELLRRLKGVA